MATDTVKKKNVLKGRGGLVMVAVVALLGIWLIADFKFAPPPRDPDSMPPVSDFVRARSGDVTRVEVKRPEGGFALAKRGSDWVFESPRPYRANGESVTSWLKGLLEDGTVSRTVEGRPADMSQFGLDRPAVELILTTKGGDTRTLQIGKDFKTSGTAGAGDIFYAREAKDGRLFMLPSFRVTEIKGKKIDDLRDKRLVEIADEKDVSRVVVQRSAGTLEVEQTGKEKWELRRPFAAPADKFDVESLVSSLKSAQADSFAEDTASELAKYGLDRPRLTVQVTEKKGTHEVLFGKEAAGEKVYAARRGSNEVMLVAKSTFEQLDKKPADLRERELITLDRDRVSSVELKNAHGATRFQRVSGNEWQFAGVTDPKQKKAKADMVQRIIDSARSPAFKHVEEAPGELEKYGLVKPEITVTLSDGGKTEVYLLGKRTGEGNYYAKGVPNAVFEVQPFVYSDFNVKADAFRDTEKK